MDQNKVRKLFVYEKDTGNLIWRIKRKGRKGKLGCIAGTMNSSGYRAIRIDGRSYYLHRLVWLYHQGYIPENNIDHINRDKTDNRIENLREVSQACNVRNSPLRKDNISGIKGIYPNKLTEKWEVSIGGRYLKIFDDFVEAVATRLAAEQALNWSGCDSTSPAYIYMEEYVNRNR